MGNTMSCSPSHETGLFKAVESGDLETVKRLIGNEMPMLDQRGVFYRDSVVHVAAKHGKIDVLSWLLDRGVSPDLVNRFKQTPLMVAAIHGNISCVQRLLDAGANILMFDSFQRRTCLHYAASHGDPECLQAILSAARSSQVAACWGYVRFVNIRDVKGATPLHLAARQRRSDCVRILLDHGALVCASTGGYGCPGSSPLHLAARCGSLECIRELLAWGADRLQRDADGRIPYMVAVRHRYRACAALLNPSSAEPLVWPSPLKFIGELNPEAKLLLERALMEANQEREKKILKGTLDSSPSASSSDSGFDDGLSEASDTELCSICFEHVCTIEVQDCGHRMCAHCTLALCCHNKPNPTTAAVNAPVCPFCRSSIARLVVAQCDADTERGADLSCRRLRRSRGSWNRSEGDDSFKGLAAVGSFRLLSGRGSGRILDGHDWVDKPDP